jgi:hypothetical protein
MYKKLLKLVAVCLGFGSAVALAQLPPVCDPCNCPDPSCYECHTSCPSSLAALARKRHAKKPQAKKPDAGLLVLASATPLAAGLLAIARLRIVRASQRMK